VKTLERESAKRGQYLLAVALAVTALHRTCTFFVGIIVSLIKNVENEMMKGEVGSHN